MSGSPSMVLLKGRWCGISANYAWKKESLIVHRRQFKPPTPDTFGNLYCTFEKEEM